jgi:acetylornithine aminotransferase
VVVYQHAGIEPDVVLLAKGLPPASPSAPAPARGAAAEVFAGNAWLHVRATLAASPQTLEATAEENLMNNAERVGSLILSGLREGLQGVAGVTEIRGHGLMIGVELDRPCGDLVKRALDAGLLINVTMDNIVRLLPPLVMKEGEARQVLSILLPLVRDFLAQTRAAVAARA